MRKEFVPCKTKAAALRKCPWAVMVVEVEGGHIAFESLDDYETWKKQK